MKVTITDGVALRAIPPFALEAFARKNGWSKAEAYGENGDIYTSPDHMEIILPRTDRLADYASVVSRLIGIWAEARGGDELAVYSELMAKEDAWDVLRGCAPDATGDLSSEAFIRKLRDEWPD